MRVNGEHIDYNFYDMLISDGVQSVGDTCPKCGCQVNSMFNTNYRIHNVEKCTGILNKKKTNIMKPLILLDNGHGCNTKGKRSPIWTDGSQLFEYEFNRAIVDSIAVELNKLNVKFELLTPELKDVPLRKRVGRANKISKKNKKCLLISVHSNAGGGTGVEIFTSPGKTKSDAIATVFGEEFKKAFPVEKLRTDYSSDGDLDKEAKFTILTKTKMPAILTENFFMDNEWECKSLLMNKNGHKAIINYHVEAIKRVIKEDLI